MGQIGRGNVRGERGQQSRAAFEEKSTPGGVAHLNMAGSSTMDDGVPLSGGLDRDKEGW